MCASVLDKLGAF